MKVSLAIILILPLLREKTKSSLLLPTLGLLLCCTLSRFLIPIYERAMSKVGNNISFHLEPSWLFVLLPLLIHKYIQLYQASKAVSQLIPPSYQLLNYVLDFIIILYEVIAIFGLSSYWCLHLPKIIYLGTICLFAGILFDLLTTKNSKESKEKYISYCHIGNSLLYNIQIILGEPQCALSYLIIYCEILCITRILESFEKKRMASFAGGMFCYLNSVGAFYMTGHVPRFTHLQLFSGFVGFEKFHYATAPLLVFLNISGPLFLTMQTHELKVVQDKKERLDKIIEQYAVTALLWGIQCSCLAIFLTVENENLHFADYMAPKFIFDVALGMSSIVFLTGKIFLLNKI